MKYFELPDGNGKLSKFHMDEDEFVAILTSHFELIKDKGITIGRDDLELWFAMVYLAWGDKKGISTSVAFSVMSWLMQSVIATHYNGDDEAMMIDLKATFERMEREAKEEEER